MHAQDLSPRQSQVLQLIETYIHEHDFPPTIQELCELGQVSSTATMHQHVKALERKGYLSPQNGKKRSLALIGQEPRGIPLIGQVAAGTAIEAVENVERYVDVPAIMFRKRPDYLLRVRGDSMIDAGIHDGDWIAIRKADTAQPGEIVIAMRDGDVTVKELSIEAGYVVLKPHNKAMKPIRIPPDEVSIVGVYTGGLMRPS
jgi:repressor LexA